MAAVCLVTGLGCTDTGLEPPLSPGTVYDDELHLNAQVCLTPASDAAFPVKILFVVDNSDSMNVTDPGSMRATAVSTVISRYSAQPGVTFGLIVFESEITRVTTGFVTGPIALNLTKADRPIK